jgi:hypothetical protein
VPFPYIRVSYLPLFSLLPIPLLKMNSTVFNVSCSYFYRKYIKYIHFVFSFTSPSH